MNNEEKSQELSDYLFSILKTINFENEKDKKELIEYINQITENSKHLYSFLDKEKNISKIIRFLESLTKGEDNV